MSNFNNLIEFCTEISKGGVSIPRIGFECATRGAQKEFAALEARVKELDGLVPDDTKRMDWLCAHCVEVRDPQMYGSHAMFHAQQDSEEWDLPFHTTLREQIDEAMRNIEEAK